MFALLLCIPQQANSAATARRACNADKLHLNASASKTRMTRKAKKEDDQEEEDTGNIMLEVTGRSTFIFGGHERRAGRSPIAQGARAVPKDRAP